MVERSFKVQYYMNIVHTIIIYLNPTSPKHKSCNMKLKINRVLVKIEVKSLKTFSKLAQDNYWS